MTRILIAHNRYRQPGGEEVAVDQDVAMLRAAGHEVTLLSVDSTSIRSTGDKLRTAARLADNAEGVALVADMLAQSGAEILHVHNFFPLLSPGICRAAREADAAVVQTLHNYRTVCAGALLMRDGAPCHKCLTGSPWWGTVHRCYRGSMLGSAALSRMIAHHRRAGTWERDVDRFVVLSRFAKARFAEAGFPEERMVVRPNAVDDPGEPSEGKREDVVFAGRLSEEKGIRVLIDAAAMVSGRILVVGEGDLGPELQARAPENVCFLGRKSRAEVRALIAGAKALVLPSICYEGSPMTLSEAYAAGTPVIGSRRGSLIELIDHGQTGLHAEPGNARDLADQINRLLSGAEGDAMGQRARRYYDDHLTLGAALETLEMVYDGALSRRGSGAACHARASAARTPAQKASAIASME